MDVASNPLPQVWDAKPELLNNKQVGESAYALIGGSVAASLIAGFITLDASKKKGK